MLFGFRLDTEMMKKNLILFLFFLFLPQASFAVTGLRYYQALTGEDGESEKSQWDRVYGRKKGYIYGKNPSPFLIETLRKYKIPKGKALDLAMGEGRNTVFLARHGFEAIGVDLSPIAAKKAKFLAAENRVRIKVIVADLERYQIPKNSYDLILVFEYVQKSIVPQIIKGLRPGGVLIFESFTEEYAKQNPHYPKQMMVSAAEVKK